MGFGQRVNELLLKEGITPADLSRELGWNTGVLSQYMNNPNRDPRLSTAAKIAETLDVSLDYLAGRTDNPMGMCDEELEGLHIDSEARALLRGFELLPKEGRDAISDQVEFQLSKSKAKGAERLEDNKAVGVA